MRTHTFLRVMRLFGTVWHCLALFAPDYDWFYCCFTRIYPYLPVFTRYPSLFYPYLPVFTRVLAVVSRTSEVSDEESTRSPG